MLDYRNIKREGPNQVAPEHGWMPGVGVSICPKCRGPAVYREVDGKLMGACCAPASRKCWWTKG